MEKKGVKIDVAFLKELSTSYHKELSKLEKKIWEYAGIEFNINSPKQLGEILFDKMLLTAKGLKKTTGGARSTRESELRNSVMHIQLFHYFSNIVNFKNYYQHT